MGSKHILAREARREAKRLMKDEAVKYREQFLKRLASYDICIKPKPKYMPKRLWQWFAHKVIDFGELEKRINE